MALLRGRTSRGLGLSLTAGAIGPGCSARRSLGRYCAKCPIGSWCRGRGAAARAVVRRIACRSESRALPSQQVPKYEPLRDFLAGLPRGQKQITLGFARLEELLGD